MATANDKTPLLPQQQESGKFVQKRGVTALQLTMMIYFFTSGGPFGIEAAVGAAGPLLTLISLVVVPLCWSVPQAIMSAELALMTEENGGNVVWVQRAFGDFLGWYNAFNYLASSFSSLSLLSVLFVEYIPVQFTFWEAYAIKAGFILLNMTINIGGLRWISRLSVVFLIFVLSPFFAEVALVFVDHRVDISPLKYVPPFHEVQWGVFLSTVIWSYGGFDSMGSLAGEVKGGRSTFIAGIAGSIPLIFCNYFAPIFFSYSVHPYWQDWESGYFTDIAYMLKGWLGVWMVSASAVSNFGQFNSTMAPLARSVWAMARGKGTSRKLPRFIGWYWKRKKTGTVRPIAAIIFTAVMCLILIFLPFNILVQIFLVIRVGNLTCEYAALIRLKYTEPDTPRPFVVPGGMVAAWCLGLPSACLASFCLYHAEWKVWAVGGTVNAMVLLSYGVVLLFRRFCTKPSSGLTADHHGINDSNKSGDDDDDVVVEDE